jgi:DNA-binding transcriptional LysR family regulator
MLAAGLAGCGIMQMPTWLVAEDIRQGRLIPLLPADSSTVGQRIALHLSSESQDCEQVIAGP